MIVWKFRVYRHPAAWKLLPWLQTHGRSWRFTWLFVEIDRITIKIR